MTIGKTIALTIQTFVNKVMSLLFNMLSRFIIALEWMTPQESCLLLPPHSVDNKKERGEWKEEKFHPPTLLNSAKLQKSKEEKGERKISVLLTYPPSHFVDNKKGKWRKENFCSLNLTSYPLCGQ